MSRLEAAGGVHALEGDEELLGALGEAQERHAAVHDGYFVGGVGDASRVKCLHAHLAAALAGGGSEVGDWILDRADASWPASCCGVQAA